MPRDLLAILRHLAEEVRTPADHVLTDQISNARGDFRVRKNVPDSAILQVGRTDRITVTTLGDDFRDLHRKLGLTTVESEDRRLSEDFLEAMHRSHADFTLTFRALCEAQDDQRAAGIRGFFADRRDFDDWAERWRARLCRQPR